MMSSDLQKRYPVATSNISHLSISNSLRERSHTNRAAQCLRGVLYNNTQSVGQSVPMKPSETGKGIILEKRREEETLTLKMAHL